MTSTFIHSESSHSLTLDDRNKLDIIKQNCPVPKCEGKRLQVLRETNLFDSTDESELYDRYVSLVNRLFKVPVVFISLIDLDRQWIKAEIGMDKITEIPRKSAICNRIILEESPQVLATEDMQKDERFVSYCNTFIPNEANANKNAPDAVRFYASACLTVDGYKIGTLSLFDIVPRPELVEKALKLLPDFAAIISDALDRRHKRLLGTGSELAELSMSVMYNLKYPLAAMQQTVASLGECVAFQPTKRVSKVAVTQSADLTLIGAPDTSARTESSDDIFDRDDTSSNGDQSSMCSPKVFLNEHLHTATCGPLCPLAQKHIKYRKHVNLDLIRAEKEKLVDLMLDLRRRTSTLIKQMDRSLIVAHSLQAQFQRHHESCRRPTPQGSFSAGGGGAALRKAHDCAAKEKVCSNAKMSNRLKCIYLNYIKSSLCDPKELTYAVDPVLLQCAENEGKRYQFNSKATMLLMYTTLYHLGKTFPGSRMDVSVRFEERDYLPIYLQLANRVGSPNSRFNSHKLGGGGGSMGSPSSTKSAMESGKETRLPSFSQPVTLVTLSGSSDGSSAVEHLREFVLVSNTSRRSSVDDNSISNNHNLYSNSNSAAVGAGAGGASVASNGSTTSAGAVSGTSSMFPAEGGKAAMLLPAPLHIPSYFTSPRSSVRRTSNSKNVQVPGDIFVTFRCALKGTSSPHPVPPPQQSENGIVDAATVTGGVVSGGSKKVQFSLEANIENDTFEKIILRNILSTVHGGFVSSSGVEFNPDAPSNPGNWAPTPFGGSGNGATNDSGTSTLPPSLKVLPRNLQEDVKGEEGGGEVDYYTLTIRIPCNVFSAHTTSSDTALNMLQQQMQQQMHHAHHHSHFQSVAHGGSPDLSAQKRLNMGMGTSSSGGATSTATAHLTPIQSMRNFSSAGSSILTHTNSSSSSKKDFFTGTLDFGRSSSTIIVESNKTACNNLPGLHEDQQLSMSPRSSVRAKPGCGGNSVPTSPTAADAVAAFALKQKLGHSGGGGADSSVISTPVGHKSKMKPLPSSSSGGLFGRPGSILGLPGALLSQMSYSLFGIGASSAANRRRLTETIKVTPSPTHM